LNELDLIDLQLLAMLQDNGRASIADLALQVGLTAPTVQRRVRLLEERGYIRGYTALLEPLRLGLPVTAFIFVESAAGCALAELDQFLANLSGVQEVHRLVGEWCYLLKVRTASPQQLEELLYRDLRKHPSVRRTHTTLATSSVREAPRLNLPSALAHETA